MGKRWRPKDKFHEFHSRKLFVILPLSQITFWLIFCNHVVDISLMPVHSKIFKMWNLRRHALLYDFKLIRNDSESIWAREGIIVHKAPVRLSPPIVHKNNDIAVRHREVLLPSKILIILSSNPSKTELYLLYHHMNWRRVWYGLQFGSHGKCMSGMTNISVKPELIGQEER